MDFYLEVILHFHPCRSNNGFPTGLLTGFMNFVAGIGKDFKTDYIVFALDAKGTTFRNELFDNYKAQRPDVPEDLLSSTSSCNILG